MSQCRRRLMVDGTPASRQARDGTVPIEFCTGSREQLCPREQSYKSDARTRPDWEFYTLCEPESSGQEEQDS